MYGTNQAAMPRNQMKMASDISLDTTRGYHRSGRLELRRALPLPLLGVGAEVDEPRLLPLLGRVQRDPVAQAGLVRDRVQPVFALLLGAPMRHREQVVRPVGIG